MKIWAVMLRDLLRLLRNPITLASTILMPLLYLFVLGNSLQGPLTGLRLGLSALDDGPQARALYGGLQAVEHGPRTFVLVPFRDPTRGLQAIHDGEVQGLLLVPHDFSRRASHGEEVAVGLFVDNVDAISSTTLEQSVAGAVAALREPVVRFEEHLAAPRVRAQEMYPRVDYDTSLVPGVVVLSIFMASMITGAFNVVMDRFLGVHEAYLSTPLRRVDINVGVLSSGTLVSVASSTVVLVVGLLATGARVQGGLAGWLVLAGTVVMTGLGMLAMMMLLLGRASHPRVSGVVSGFLNILLFFPSGALYPIQSFPGWLRAFAHVDPETHAVAALKSLLFRGGNVAAAATHLAFLGAFTAAMLLASTATLKRTL